MLIIDTYLDEVPGKGIGLFCKNGLKKGESYWVRDAIFDKLIIESEFLKYSPHAQFFIKEYGFQESSGNWYLCIDNARFVNHDASPNTFNHFNQEGELMQCTAVRDISPREEILCDYRKTCVTCIMDIGFKEYQS